MTTSAKVVIKSKIIKFIYKVILQINQYFVQLNYYTSQEWQYGYKEAIKEVILLQDNYKQIVVSDDQPLDKSYMFFLFYLKFFLILQYDVIPVVYGSGPYDMHIPKSGYINVLDFETPKDLLTDLKKLLFGTFTKVPNK